MLQAQSESAACSELRAVFKLSPSRRHMGLGTVLRGADRGCAGRQSVGPETTSLDPVLEGLHLFSEYHGGLA